MAKATTPVEPTVETTPAEAVVIEMTLDKETPNTFRFAANDEDAPVPTVYVKRSAFDGKPESITLTIS